MEEHVGLVQRFSFEGTARIIRKVFGTDYLREIGSLPDRNENQTVHSLGSLK